MTLGELRTVIREQTDKPSTILTDARCLRFVRRTLERMVNRYDWQGQGRSALLTYDAASDGIDLPVDFISEKHVSQITAGEGDPSQRLQPIAKLMGGREAWLDSFATATSNPRRPLPRGGTEDIAYYFWDEKLFIVPNPSAEMQVMLDYLEALQMLPDDANASNVLTARYGETVVTWGAIREAELFLHRWELAERAEQLFQGFLDGARTRDLSTKLSGPKHHRGP